jgi:O-antigen/teichoic acid export membrane protein
MLTAFAGRLAQAAALVSAAPFEQRSEQARARERHRRVALSIVAAALARLVSVGTTLVSVPLTLHYLGAERYGMWIAMSSVIAMLAFADLGMGSGILNAVAESHGRDDRDTMRRNISSGYLILGLIGALAAAVFFVLYPHFDWGRLFNVQSPEASAQAGPVLAVLVAAFALNMPLCVVQRVQAGLQQGFSTSLWQCVGSLLGLAAVLIAIRSEAALPWLVAGMVGGPLVAVVINNIYFFGFARRDLRPAPSYLHAVTMQQIVGRGFWFLLVQVAASLAYASDNFVIAQVLGAGAVAEYAVPEKMFALVTVLVGLSVGPLWPAYGEAIARGDGNWVRQTLKRSTAGAVAISALIASTLVVFGDHVLSIWVGSAIAPSLLLLAVLGVWKVMEASGNALAVFLNGANLLRMQAILSVTMALSAFALKFLLVQHMGVAGAPLATTICYAAFVLSPWCFLLPRIVQDLDRTRMEP